MIFRSRLGTKLFAVAAGILLIGSADASARPQNRHAASRAIPVSACSGFFFCGQQSVAQTPAEARAAAREARRQAAEQAAQMRQVTLQQRAAARQQAIEARTAAQNQSFSSAGSSATQRVATTVTGGRPSGCPAKFCGCGASIEVFGQIIQRLNRAANWFRDFPHVAYTNASAGMVAGNSRHVFVLKEHLRNDVWLVKNYNGADHKTSLQERRLSQYTVVDPRGSRLALASAD
jgi:hypothetical protein